MRRAFMDEQPDQSLSVAEPNPAYFPVSILKLVVLSICTFGIYEIYWYYNNWCAIRDRDKVEMVPLGRAIFAYFFCYSLFKDIKAKADSQGIETSVEPAALTTGWIVFTLLVRLPDPFWLISFFSVVFLLPVQSAVNKINGVRCPSHDRNRAF